MLIQYFIEIEACQKANLAHGRIVIANGQRYYIVRSHHWRSSLASPEHFAELEA